MCLRLQNPFDTAGQPGSFGLAPQFNASAGGTLKRLSYGGRGTVGYDEQPIASGGAVNLACGLGYIDAPFQAAYVGVSERCYAHVHCGTKLTRMALTTTLVAPPGACRLETATTTKAFPVGGASGCSVTT